MDTKFGQRGKRDGTDRCSNNGTASHAKVLKNRDVWS